MPRLTKFLKDQADQILSECAALTRHDAESIRAVRRKASARLADTPGPQVIQLAAHLIESTGGGNRFIAYELIYYHQGALEALGPAEITLLGQGIDSWGAVDCFGCFVSGPAWRQGQTPDSLIEEWARSEDRWWRRAALVSTVPLNSKARGGSGDPQRTLAVCKLLIADRDDMAVKALSWALRELSKRDPDAVRGFLDNHRSQLAPRVIREVESKLSTGRKIQKRAK